MSKLKKNYFKYTMAPYSSNHGHISCNWYVLIFGQWLLKRFSPPSNTL